jgi:hypothetical protein
MVFSRTVSPPKSFLPVAASAAARFAAADRCCETRGGREGFAHRDIDDALFLGGARVAFVELNREPLDWPNVVQKEVFRDTVPWIVIRVCS